MSADPSCDLVLSNARGRPRLPTRPRCSTDEAQRIHETVHPSKWCITYADLRLFECQVAEALRDGTFDYEPNIYEVNEYYIKPVTASAGKLSWALMMNPFGLDSDLFISHAWEEDIFDFTQKVWASWPWKARHAWCCMLANPQNLDIGAFLESPCSSPFALALQCSKYMLVVPNKYASIYTRLWCGYEAYLAFKSDKIIQIATPPIYGEVILAWIRMIPAVLIGLALPVLHEYLHPMPYSVPYATVLALLASLVSQICGHARLCLIANHVGLAFATSLLKLMHLNKIVFPLLPESMKPGLDQALRVEVMLYFFLAEVDRVRWQVEQESEGQLRNQFPGSVRHASCSDAQDTVNIFSEIVHQIDDVDKAIRTLLKAGLSSDAFRHADAQGVELQHAQAVHLAIPALVLGPGVLLNSYLLLRISYIKVATSEPIVDALWPFVVIWILALLARLYLWKLLLSRSVDERCWILSVMSRTVAPWVVCCLALELSTRSFANTLARFFYYLSFLVTCFFSALGIRGTLSLPFGKLLAKFYLQHLSCWPEDCYEPISSSSDSGG